jgi:hypothetical protein
VLFSVMWYCLICNLSIGQEVNNYLDMVNCLLYAIHCRCTSFELCFYMVAMKTETLTLAVPWIRADIMIIGNFSRISNRNESSCLPGCDIVSLGMECLMFWRIIVPSSLPWRWRHYKISENWKLFAQHYYDNHKCCGKGRSEWKKETLFHMW